MKLKLTLLLVCFSIVFYSNAQNLPSYVPKSGIELWYSLNNSLAADSSGNMRDGILSRQNKVAGRNGCLNSALEFNRDGDSLGVHYGVNLFANQFTISLWSNANPQDTNIHSFVSWNDSMGGFQFGLYNSQILFDFNKFGNKITSTSTLSNIGLGATKNWHHYVMTYSLGATRIYVDTVLKVIIPGVIAINPNANIIFGNSIFGEAAGGALEDIGWWSRLLTVAEIQSLYFNQPISATITSHQALCGNQLSTAAVHVSGSVFQNYTYTWTARNSTPTVIGVGDSVTSSVSEQLTVLIQDQNDRCLTLPVTLTVPAAIQIQTVFQTAPSCYGDSNATIIQAVTGGTLNPTSNYQLTWTPAVSTNDTAQYLPQGIYLFNASDDNGCITVDTIVITAPKPLQFGIHRASEPACVFSANGNVQAIASGGTPPYYYIWGSSNGGVTSYAGNALYCANGTYTVYVTDAHNCFLASTDTFNQQTACPFPITIPPYMSTNGLYAWYPFNHNTLDESGFMNFGSNFGGVYVPNRSSCSESAISLNSNATIIQDSVALGTGYAFNLNQFSIAAWLQTNSNPQNHNATIFSNLNTFGNGYWIGVRNDTIVFDLNRQNGSLNLISSNAYINPNKPSLLTFTYDANMVNVYIDSALAFVDSNVIFNLAPNCRAILGNTHYGEYYSGILDDIAVYSRAISLSEVKLLYNYSPITATVNVTNNSCGGAANGAAYLQVNYNGHVANYMEYQWNPSVSTVDSAINLYAGNYQCVVVADYMNCATVNFTVNQPTPIQVIVDSSFLNQPCAGQANGFVAVHAGVGGIQPYTYAWSNGSTNTSIHNLANGAYSVLVTDANNCHAYDTFHVVSPTPLLANASTTTITCGASNDASINLYVVGGIPMYHYMWQFNAAPLAGNTNTQQNLGAGIYSCIITDSNVCSTTIIDTIVAGPTANFVLVEPRDTLQFWTSSLALNVLSSSSGINYQWQVDSSGIWINCHDGYKKMTYSGINSSYLEIFITTLTPTVDQYRCVLSDSICSDTTRSARVDFEFGEGFANTVAKKLYNVYWSDEAHQTIHLLNNNVNASQIEIRNTIGQIIYKQAIAFGVNQISTPALNDGLYIISISDRNNKVSYNTKLIK